MYTIKCLTPKDSFPWDMYIYDDFLSPYKLIGVKVILFGNGRLKSPYPPYNLTIKERNKNSLTIVSQSSNQKVRFKIKVHRRYIEVKRHFILNTEVSPVDELRNFINGYTWIELLEPELYDPELYDEEDSFSFFTPVFMRLGDITFYDGRNISVRQFKLYKPEIVRNILTSKLFLEGERAEKYFKVYHKIWDNIYSMGGKYEEKN